MRRERRPPWWLMYATVAVLSVRTSTCFSCGSVLKRRRASHTASNSRQLICHCSWGPDQSPAAACPLVEASVDTTTCLDTCTRGTPAQRKARSDHGLKVWQQDGVTETRYMPWRHAQLGTPAVKPTLKRSHMKQSERRDSGCGCHMPQEPLKVFQWNRPLALERLQAVQH